jgi:hypothetical protein
VQRVPFRTATSIFASLPWTTRRGAVTPMPDEALMAAPADPAIASATRTAAATFDLTEAAVNIETLNPSVGGLRAARNPSFE